MNSNRIISASILSANFAILGQEVNAVLKAGAERIHVDVMDQHYVPNLTFGPLVVEALRNYGITAPLDVHLMVEPVDELIVSFAKAGANCICFHPEASRHVDRSLALIKSFGVEAGLALNPATSIDVLSYVWEKLDRILVMSVNPGFGGQQFIRSSLDKIKLLRQEIDQRNLAVTLEIDGGVSPATINEICAAGANMFVVGSALYKAPNQNYAAVIDALKN